MTPTLISTIMGTPRVRDPKYPWLANYLPTRIELVECFVEGYPHQIETEGESSFQMHDLNNNARCIYRILVNRILLVLSLTMITIERARCLYALLTKASIDYGSLVTSTMMSARLADSSTAFPKGALITRIVEHVGVPIAGMRELAPEKAPIDAGFLNLSNGHLLEPTRELRPRQPRAMRMDGASTSVSYDERLDKMESTLRDVQRSLLQSVQ